jgi:hypothetical protein
LNPSYVKLVENEDAEGVRVEIITNAGELDNHYTQTIKGNILPELCHKCGTSIIYGIEADATLCPSCNVWLESACSDPNCQFCANRSDRPLSR